MEIETQKSTAPKKDSLLIVDDDAGIRDMLKLLFEVEDFFVHTAANGQEALELLAQIPPPCMILLDLMMPVMNGWEFLDAKKKLPKLASIPVVIVSAFNDETKSSDVVKFVKKPADVDLLIEMASSFAKQTHQT
ncbi:MAG: response regulator [Methylotenera sp.]|nr:response regulator [Oligoflexia bacterium]